MTVIDLTSTTMLAHTVEPGEDANKSLRLYTATLPGGTGWITMPPLRAPTAVPNADGSIVHNFAYDPPATIGVGGSEEFAAITQGTVAPSALSWGAQIWDGFFSGGGYTIPVLGSYQEEGVVYINSGSGIWLGNDADDEYGSLRIDVATGEVFYGQLESGSFVEKKFDVVVPRWRGNSIEPFYYHLAKTTTNGGADSQVTLTVRTDTTSVSTPLVFTAPGTPVGSGSFQLGRTVAGQVPSHVFAWFRAGWAAGVPGGFGSAALSDPKYFEETLYNANGTTGAFLDAGVDDEYWRSIEFFGPPDQRFGTELEVKWVASNTAPAAGTLPTSTWAAATWVQIPRNGTLFLYDGAYPRGRYLSLQFRFAPAAGFVDLDGWRPHVVSIGGVVGSVVHQSTEPPAPAGDPPAIPLTLNVDEGSATLEIPIRPSFPYTPTSTTEGRTTRMQHGLRRSHTLADESRTAFPLTFSAMSTADRDTLFAFLKARLLDGNGFLVRRPDDTTIAVALAGDEFEATQVGVGVWQMAPLQVEEIFPA